VRDAARCHDHAAAQAAELCSALDLAPSPVAVVDFDGRCLAHNRTLARRAGFGSGSVCGRALLPEASEFRQALAAVGSATPARAEGRVPLLPGSLWRVYLSPFAPGSTLLGAVALFEQATASGAAAASVTERRLRVLIGADGELKRAQRVEATSEIRRRRPEERFEQDDGKWASSDAASPPFVLVLDDEARLGALTVNLLEAHGFRAAAVTTAGDALARLTSTSQRVDVLLADLQLRGTSALGLLNALDEQRVGVPVVITSGIGEEDLPPEVRGHPRVVGYLPKPYTSADAVRVVERALGR
jgi:CheY-like chemotaxis protein